MFPELQPNYHLVPVSSKSAATTMSPCKYMPVKSLSFLSLTCCFSAKPKAKKKARMVDDDEYKDDDHEEKLKPKKTSTKSAP